MKPICCLLFYRCVSFNDFAFLSNNFFANVCPLWNTGQNLERGFSICVKIGLKTPIFVFLFYFTQMYFLWGIPLLYPHLPAPPPLLISPLELIYKCAQIKSCFALCKEDSATNPGVCVFLYWQIFNAVLFTGTDSIWGIIESAWKILIQFGN